MIERLVGRDPIQPTGKSGITPKTPEPLVCRQERVLKQIHRGFAIGGHFVKQGKHLIFILSYQFVKCSAVAGLSLCNQCLFVQFHISPVLFL